MSASLENTSASPNFQVKAEKFLLFVGSCLPSGLSSFLSSGLSSPERLRLKKEFLMKLGNWLLGLLGPVGL